MADEVRHAPKMLLRDLTRRNTLALYHKFRGLLKKNLRTCRLTQFKTLLKEASILRLRLCVVLGPCRSHTVFGVVKKIVKIILFFPISFTQGVKSLPSTSLLKERLEFQECARVLKCCISEDKRADLLDSWTLKHIFRTRHPRGE